MRLPLGCRADILVADTVILELKAVPALSPAHEAQLLTYPRMSSLPVGLPMNVHATRLKDGPKRFIASSHDFVRRPSRPSCFLRVENGGRTNRRLAGAGSKRPCHPTTGHSGSNCDHPGRKRGRRVAGNVL
jgi:hypothetical protein